MAVPQISSSQVATPSNPSRQAAISLYINNFYLPLLDTSTLCASLNAGTRTKCPERNAMKGRLAFVLLASAVSAAVPLASVGELFIGSDGGVLVGKKGQEWVSTGVEVSNEATLHPERLLEAYKKPGEVVTVSV